MGRRGIRRDLERRGWMRDLARGPLPAAPAGSGLLLRRGLHRGGLPGVPVPGPARRTRPWRSTVTYLFTRRHPPGEDLRRAGPVPPHRGRERRGGRGQGGLDQVRVGRSLRRRAAHVLRLHRGGEHWTGGHDAVGAIIPSRQTWYFAEGYTGPGFDEWICVLNPGDAAADLTFHFQTQEAGEIVVDGHDRPRPLPRHLQGQRPAGRRLPDLAQARVDRRRWWPSAPCTSTTWARRHPGTGPGATASWGHRPSPTSTSSPRAPPGPASRSGSTIQNPQRCRITVNASTSWARAGDPVQAALRGPAKAAGPSIVNGPDEVGAERTSRCTSPAPQTFLAERPMYFDYTGTGRLGLDRGPLRHRGRARAPGPGSSPRATPGTASRSGCASRTPGTAAANVTITYYPEGEAIPS